MQLATATTAVGPLRLLAFICLLAVGGCHTLGDEAQLQRLSLPDAGLLECCWQEEELVQVSAPQLELALTAAASVQQGKLVVVVFDPLGRRLATVVHTEGDPVTLSAPEGWPPALSRQLLLAFYLHHLRVQQWQPESKDWTVTSDERHKYLRYKGHEVVVLEYADMLDEAGKPATMIPAERTLQFSQQKLSLRLLTLSRTVL